MNGPEPSDTPGVLLLTNTAAVYRLELYNSLARDPRCRFLAVFTALDDPATAHCRGRNEDMEFDRVSPRPLALPFLQGPGRPLRGLGTLLDRFRPTAVVMAGASPAVMQCTLLARRRGCRTFLWWGGTALSEAGEGQARVRWRRLLFSLIQGFLAYSEQAADYLMSHGVPRERIYVLGNITFDAEARRARMETLPREPGRPPRLLAVGQLSARKNLGFLLEVFARLQEPHPGLELHIVGSGPAHADLIRSASDRGLRGVRFLGALDNARTLECYRQADILVHPARMDQWPQVINEGLTAGMPVVASTSSGISPRVVQDGINGWLLELDVSRWVERLHAILDDPGECTRMGRASLKILGDFRLDTVRNRLLDFVLEGTS